MAASVKAVSSKPAEIKTEEKRSSSVWKIVGAVALGVFVALACKAAGSSSKQAGAKA
jgi:hypothetical protein